MYFLGCKDGLCAGTTTLPTLCGDHLEIVGDLTSAYPGLHKFLYLSLCLSELLSFTPQV